MTGRKNGETGKNMRKICIRHCRKWIGNKIVPKISHRSKIFILFKLKTNANFYQYKE